MNYATRIGVEATLNHMEAYSKEICADLSSWSVSRSYVKDMRESISCLKTLIDEKPENENPTSESIYDTSEMD